MEMSVLTVAASGGFALPARLIYGEAEACQEKISSKSYQHSAKIFKRRNMLVFPLKGGQEAWKADPMHTADFRSGLGGRRGVGPVGGRAIGPAPADARVGNALRTSELPAADSPSSHRGSRGRPERGGAGR